MGIIISIHFFFCLFLNWQWHLFSFSFQHSPISHINPYAHLATWQREWRSPEVKPSLCPTPITIDQPVPQQAVPSSDTLRRPASASSPLSALGPPLKKASPFTSPINAPLLPLLLPERVLSPTPNVSPVVAPPLSLPLPSEVASCTVSSPLPPSFVPSDPLSPTHSFHAAVPTTTIPDLSLNSDSSLVTISNPTLTPHPTVSTHMPSVNFAAPFSTVAVDPEVNPSDVAQPGTEQTLSKQFSESCYHLLNH